MLPVDDYGFSRGRHFIIDMSRRKLNRIVQSEEITAQKNL